MPDWRTDRPKARKQHWCDMCGRVIQPGETYGRTTGLGWEGGISTWRECEHCTAFLRVADVIDWSWKNYDEGYGPEDVTEFEPRNDTERTWKDQWIARWADDRGSLVPIPQRTAAAPTPPTDPDTTGDTADGTSQRS